MSRIKYPIPIPFPKGLLDVINRTFKDEKKRQKALNVVSHIIYTCILRRIPFLVYAPYARRLKQRIVGDSNYYSVWTELVQLQILQEKTTITGKTFSTKGHKSKYIRINPKYLNENVEQVHYSPSKSAIERHACHGQIEKYVLDCLNHLALSTNSVESNPKLLLKLAGKVEERIQDSGTTIRVKHHKKWRTYQKSRIKYYEYQAFEKRSAIHSYNLKLIEIEKKDFYVSRNSTNYRIDHNLTNCDSQILGSLTLKGEPIIELDLANAQPKILALALTKGIGHKALDFYVQELYEVTSLLCSEIHKYDELCSSGELYAYMRMQLASHNVHISRDEAKILFISALYGSHHPKSKTAMQFALVFPQIAQLLKGFKEFMWTYFEDAETEEHHELAPLLTSKTKGLKSAKEAGKDYLSIIMQRKEVSIFIDTLLVRLMDEGMVVIPRHDSVLCAESDLVPVERVMKEVLDDFFGRNKYVIRKKALAWKEADEDYEVKYIRR